ncbi:hydroxypyruvate isomerase [Pelagibacterium lacus]|uniref:Hydroxypyruvate isomerase n=1 Tax=Pelagibacterium lacus TaxID=2282655 RepID=A0A369W1Z2_9HYPH|nr:hydroxypyruvate isomerase [Pelagibacterium lacus]RDE08704.1 hydroxypyruvate isomerase [Pelagibacterium lacus]
MPKFCANLTMLFNEVPFPERFARAAASGFEGVEFLFPYEFEADALKDELRTHGLTQVLHNLPAGNWQAGERGNAIFPDRTEEFRQGVDKAIRYATTLECDKVNCLAGIMPADADPDLVRSTFVENLRFAAQRLGEHGIRLLIEPLNRFDVPGFYLNTVDQAVDIINETGSDNIAVQFDLYHQQRTRGELIGTFQTHAKHIGHVQLADNPGRHEPGTGEINFPFIFRTLDAAGYDGWIGCEYAPLGGTEDGLGWMQNT